MSPMTGRCQAIREDGNLLFKVEPGRPSVGQRAGAALDTASPDGYTFNAMPADSTLGHPNQLPGRFTRKLGSGELGYTLSDILTGFNIPSLFRLPFSPDHAGENVRHRKTSIIGITREVIEKKRQILEAEFFSPVNARVEPSVRGMDKSKLSPDSYIAGITPEVVDSKRSRLADNAGIVTQMHIAQPPDTLNCGGAGPVAKSPIAGITREVIESNGLECSGWHGLLLIGACRSTGRFLMDPTCSRIYPAIQFLLGRD